ncbi:MAG TPA: hypothetical protein VK903_00505 [Propionicimonas sp.]|nr:hypothetical protein [Propionicimonas sp.]
MSRHRLLALLAAVVGLALTGCGVTPPVAPATSAVPSPTVSSATPTPTPSVTTPTPTPTPTPTADTSLELRGDGMGTLRFGAKQVDATDLLTERLGDPDESSQGILCELDDSSPWAQTVIYGGLWVQYSAKDGSKKSPRTLTAWGFSLQEKFAAPLKVQDGVPVNLSFAQLKAKYPKGKLENLNLGEGDGSRMFTLPNKIRFIGANKPDMMSAGAFSICE